LEASLSTLVESQQKNLADFHGAWYALRPSDFDRRLLRTEQLGTKSFKYCSPLGSQFRVRPHVEIAACIDQCDRPIPHKRLEDAQSQLSRC
jgi:hypothetical protein